MYAIVVLAVVFWASIASDDVARQYDTQYNWYDSEIKRRQMIRMSETIARYIRQTGGYPTSIATLMAQNGFEHARGYLNAWQGYAVSGTLLDGTWQFRRAVLFTFDPTKGMTASAYLAADNHERANGPACGAGGFYAATSWCGSSDSMWYLNESRDRINEQIVDERARLTRLSQKLANYYNGVGYYPKLDRLGAPLGGNSVTSLAELAGYAGNAVSCSGQYQYQGVPIDCSDMFNSFGLPVGYQFIDAGHVILVSETPIISASGTPLIIALDRA